MFVTATITLGGSESSALTVPEVAIQRGQTGDYVFVIVGEKALKRDSEG
jgi:multidrug efflux pump subunit AcrA (membrane-fusion protein)